MAPISPPAVTEYRPGFLPAYLSNGVMGLRVGRFALTEGVAILNGFAGVDGDSGAEAIARAPYPIAGDIQLDGLRLTQAPESAVFRRQEYDFGNGELRTTFSFDGGAARADVEVLTFCSRTLPMLVLQEVSITVNRACDLVIEAGVDTNGIPGGWTGRNTRTRGSTQNPVDGSLAWRSHGALGVCGAAYVTELSGADVDPEFDENQLKPLRTRYAFRARSGRRYRLRHIAALVSDTMHHQPDLQAVRMTYGGMKRGFDRLREQNREVWQTIWKSRINVVGAPRRWQALADAAFFYLQTSVHSSSPTSTGIFGLAYWPDYHYYRGHVMWDLEMFAVPPLILTNTDAARTLLEYRADRLDAARHNASMHGYRGAQFPWESSLRFGEEVAPGEASASAHEHHVSLVVAFAFSQFLHATHDWEWGRARAWPVLKEVAEWIESRGVETKRGFEIHDVTGIAEKEDTVDNNAFVNMAASIALREASTAAKLFDHENGRWDHLARSIYLPIGRDKVIRNHDAYRATEEKGETPEALAGLFPLGFECPADVERATIARYLALAGDYVGAPMLSALLGVYAARVGDRGLALELFERGYADFVVDPFATTLEYERKAFPDQQVAGPFTANLGGFLTSLLYGLSGMRIMEAEPESWCARPVTMPRGWDGIEVERLWARRRPASLTATHGDDHGFLVLED